MLPLMKSQSTAPNENFVESVRNKGETNKEWLRRHWDPNDTSQVVLVGGISPTAQRIRIAQSHSRHDFTPSLWSHVGLLIYDQKQDVFTCFQAFPLVETMPLNYPPATNAIFSHNFDMFDDQAQFPNISSIPVPGLVDDILQGIEQFKYQRAVCDTVRLTIAWMSYCWGVKAASPLLEEAGEPSACFIENVMRAVGVELSPSVNARVACPETIWQSAMWWHDFYQDRFDVSGNWHAPHSVFSA